MGITATLLFCFVVIGLMTIIGLTIDYHRPHPENRTKVSGIVRQTAGRLRRSEPGRQAIVEFNPAFQEMLGYAPEEIYRLTYQDITPEKWHPVEARINRRASFSKGLSPTFM